MKNHRKPKMHRNVNKKMLRRPKLKESKRNMKSSRLRKLKRTRRDRRKRNRKS
jgi:hypothetical protein